MDEHSDPDATVYTDGASPYRGRENHESVAHSRGEYVRGDVQTNGVESLLAVLKRAHKGHPPLDEPQAPPPLRGGVLRAPKRQDMDTIDHMETVVAGMVGKRLLYRELVPDP